MFELTSKDELISAYKLEVDPEIAADVDRNGLKLGSWSRGFFGCYGDCIPNGFMAFICPGVSVAQITARLGLLRYSLVLRVYMALYLLVFFAIVVYSSVVNFVSIVVASAAVVAVFRLRTRMRMLFNIPGNAMLDGASVLLCGPCAIAQMASHAEAYHPGSCSFRPRSTLEGYVRQ